MPPGQVVADWQSLRRWGVRISGIAVLGDREDLFGPVALMTTRRRVVDRIDADHLPVRDPGPERGLHPGLVQARE